MQKYIVQSIELHLFFARIMKEHAIFLEAGFPTKNKKYIDEADWYKKEFEQILYEVVKLSEGFIRPHVLNSGEIVTDYTLSTEIKTEELTGIKINKEITLMENNLLKMDKSSINPLANIYIKSLNSRAINLLNGLISFKERIINEMINCKIFTVNYPLLIEHILREAKLYRSYLMLLEKGEDIDTVDEKQTELFWNQIMMEHALFIRGLLDPTENDLINTSNDFAKEYGQLLVEANNMSDATIESIKNKTLEETLRYRDFKKAGTKGLDACQIKSIILPLLADHVLREANHYLRILKN
ncbi:MAG TPA: DUF2935 domain-containing protein [Tenericutes bacterium]|nr:DUF2935 domain-containing protein [Mycoplasmatota bacterium]